MPQAVKIISIEHATHDVLRIVAEKPAGLLYVPGQAADISINKPGWEDQLRPFTFTSLPSDDHLEFHIKTYPARNGVTSQLLSLSKGDELLVGEVFGAISYRGEGVFIAGGAGITPFIAILKQLENENRIGNNKLMFANKTKADIIFETGFQKILGSNFINILSDEIREGYEHGYITAELVKKYKTETTRYFYLCGPPPMMEAVEKQLTASGIAADQIIQEAF